MRVRTVAGGLTVNAVAGSYVVGLGWNVDDAPRPALRGFPIQREDKTEGETRWMKGTRTFSCQRPGTSHAGRIVLQPGASCTRRSSGPTTPRSLVTPTPTR